MTKSNPFYSPMKRASDGQLLAAVLAVPVGALLMVVVMQLATDDSSAVAPDAIYPETIAIGCAMILLLYSLFLQLAGVRFATNGPRSLQNQLGFLGALFATVLLGHMPSADQSLAQAALGWLPLPLVIALIGGMDVARHIKALRRHPRALRRMLRDVAFGLAIGLAIGAAFALVKGASAPQALWSGLVFCGAIMAAPSIPLARAVHMPNLRLAILTLAYGICLSALMFIFAFVVGLGQMESGDATPRLIGGIAGTFIGVGIPVLIARNKAKRGKPNAPPSPME